jgi:hypothetical protein
MAQTRKYALVFWFNPVDNGAPCAETAIEDAQDLGG